VRRFFIMLSAAIVLPLLCPVPAAALAATPESTLLTPAKLTLLQEPSLKDALDFQLATLRLSQKPDGSYGNGADDTANAVIAFSLGPRAYRSEDGPFIRDAIQYLRQHVTGDGQAKQTLRTKSTDMLIAAALASTDLNAHSDVIQRLLKLHQVDASQWQPATAVSNWSAAKSVEHLLGLPRNATLSDRAAACARAVFAYQKEQADKKSQMKAPELEKVYEDGADYLISQIGPSGMWEFFGQPEPGISALAARALLGSSRAEVRALAVPILDQLVQLQKENGAIHADRLPVYVTSVAIGALSAGKREADQAVIDKAANYLRAVQADGDEGYSESDKFYGGIGYGGDLRPDLSNLQYALQALKDSGAKEDDPAFQRAIKFLERSQNNSEVNTAEYKDTDGKVVVSGDDGGGIYYPGNSQAGYETNADGTVIARSYGSMTYALLKCYIFAGLDMSDSRVVKAMGWIERHYTLEVNPGFDTLRDPRASMQGLFYYYLSMAQALQASGKKMVVTPDGKKHNWRVEMQHKLAELQRKDGSWINEAAPRWWEGNEVLCTAYALDALLATQQDSND
jgi:squalene-hopene/tetraprenyl-beta-curcumene cyclase